MSLITLRSSLAGSRKVQPRYLPGDMALLPPSETRCQRASQALSRLVEAREEARPKPRKSRLRQQFPDTAPITPGILAAKPTGI